MTATRETDFQEADAEELCAHANAYAIYRRETRTEAMERVTKKARKAGKEANRGFKRVEGSPLFCPDCRQVADDEGS